jgi:phosphatidylserine/phosphatidylglycerophosphate/cardiolipin synthase-like enzyme
LAQWGRIPEKHGPLHLFVITNSTDDGMGFGTVNTYRMLESLGRADRIPEVARDQRLADVNAQRMTNEAQMEQVRSRRLALDNQAPAPQGVLSATARAGQHATLDEQMSRLQARQRELDEARTRLEPASLRERLMGSDRTPEAIKAANVPGLKVHVATLVAPDTPAGKEWQEVYIHAKLMLIDDTFMTLGSANVNTRSMETDSEMNIAHHRPEITRPLREQQWARYTGGRVAAGTAFSKAFDEWQRIMNDNAAAKREANGHPIAQLAEFLRTSDKISNRD